MRLIRRPSKKEEVTENKSLPINFTESLQRKVVRDKLPLVAENSLKEK